MSNNVVFIDLEGDTSQFEKKLNEAIKIAENAGKKISQELSFKINMDNSKINAQIIEASKKLRQISSSTKIDLKLDSAKIQKELDQTKVKIGEVLNPIPVQILDTAVQKFARDTGKALDQGTLKSLQDTHAQLERLKIEAGQVLNEAKKNFKQGFIDNAQLEKAIKNFKQVSSETTNAGRALENYKNTGDATISRMQSKFDLVKKNIISVGTAIKVYLIDRIFKFAMELSNSFNSAESAMAGYRKTLDASKQELDAINKGIINMSKRLPFTIEELSKIAETGGQMGVKADQILLFTNTIAKLSTAISGISPEKAAETLGKIIQLTGEGIGEIEHLSSSLVALGNNYKANEGQILEFGNRLGSLGGYLNLTSAEILGIAAAFIDAGIEAEAGGTAINKVFSKLSETANGGGESLNKFAKISGMTSNEFQESWKEDKVNTFINFVEGLGKAGEEGKMVLNELGLSDERLGRAFLAVANNADVLREAIAMSNEEFINSNALQEEFEKRLQTTDSQLKIQANQWRAWGLGSGSIISKIRLLWGEWALNFVPKSIAALQMLFAKIGMVIQNFGTTMVVIKDVFISSWKLIVSNTKIFFSTLVQNTKILGNNIIEAFKLIPQGIEGVINSVIDLLEKMLDAPLKGINAIIKGLKQIPGAASILNKLGLGNGIGEIKLGRASFGISGGNFKEFISGDYSASDIIKEDFRKQLEANARLIEARENGFDNYSFMLLEQADLSGKIRDEATELEKSRIEDEFNTLKEFYDDSLKLEDDFYGKSSKAGRSAEEIKKEQQKKELEAKEKQLKELALQELEALKNQVSNKTEYAKKAELIEARLNKDIKKLSMDRMESEFQEAKDILELEKARTEAKIAELDYSTLMEKKNIDESLENEIQKATKLLALEENYQKKLNEIKGEGHKNDLDIAKEMVKKADDYKKAINSSMDNAEKATEKYKDSLVKVIEKFNEMKKEATNTIRDINKELENLTLDTDTKLGERRIDLLEKEKDIQEQLKDLRDNGVTESAYGNLDLDTFKQINSGTFGDGVDIKNIIKLLELLEEQKKLKQELALITESVNEDALQEAERRNALSETERILEDKRTNQLILEERKKIYEAIQNDEIILLDEIQDYENLKIAEKLLTQREQAIEELKLAEELYKEELKLALEKDDTLREMESMYTEFLSEEIDYRKSKLLELQQQAIETARALSDLGMSLPSMDSISSNPNSNTNSQMINIENNPTFYNTIDSSLDINRVNQIVLDTMNANSKGMSGLKINN